VLTIGPNHNLILEIKLWLRQFKQKPALNASKKDQFRIFIHEKIDREVFVRGVRNVARKRTKQRNIEKLQENIIIAKKEEQLKNVMLKKTEKQLENFNEVMQKDAIKHQNI